MNADVTIPVWEGEAPAEPRWQLDVDGGALPSITRYLPVILIAMTVSVASHASAIAQDKPADAIQIDKEKKTVTIACKIAPRKLPNLTEIYPIEVIASLPAPRGRRLTRPWSRSMPSPVTFTRHWKAWG